jgi:Sugar kinases, ribokinase family
MKILGIGNALVDILAIINNEQLLEELNLPKGSMQLIDRDKRELIFSKLSDLKLSMATGGSASNTSLALSNMGIFSGFIGKIGDDEYGEFYTEELKKAGIVPHFIKEKGAASGTAMTLITPDGERTFGTYLGIAAELSEKELNPEIFKDYHFFYVEGYLVQNYALIEQALRIAKMQGLKIAIDLASYNVVESNKDFLLDLISNYVDVVFANEEEAKALTGKNAEEAVWDIASLTEIAVVKIGASGSLIVKDRELFSVEAFKAELQDATAAGDFYAAGFLYGLVKNASVPQCGKLGSLLASKVIEVVGTKLSNECWEKIRTDAKIILN